MNYRRNEDKWPVFEGVAYNAVIDVSVVESGTEPVTLTEAKAHLHITYADEDTYITSLIKRCRQAISKYTGLSLIDTTVTAILNNGSGGIELPYGPVKTFTSMVDSEDVVIDSYKLRGLDFKYLESPVNDYVKVVYTTGYTTFPEDLKHAILNEIAFRFENRIVSEALSETTKKIAFPYKRRTWL